MIIWNGEWAQNLKKQHHEPEWITWHDFQAACTWFACRKCEEKFYITDEFLDDMPTLTEAKVEEIINKQHTELIEKVKEQ